MDVTEQFLAGEEALDALAEVADLRLSIFRDYPYLYEGRIEDELVYLRRYVETDDALMVLVRDGDRVVGAATGMPLAGEDPRLVELLAAASVPPESTYTVGELLFHREYRGMGLGTRLLDRIEKKARSLGSYRRLLCMTVVRPPNHPLRPDDFVPVERFLTWSHFALVEGVETTIDWREIDGVRRGHPMRFWVREIG